MGNVQAALALNQVWFLYGFEFDKSFGPTFFDGRPLISESEFIDHTR
jgi:hypothetical protein